jgi:hypothetical protein
VAGVGHAASSASNALRVDWINSYFMELVVHADGALGLTLLPGRRGSGRSGPHHRNLQADLDALVEQHHVGTIFLLSDDEELRRIGVTVLPEAAAARGIEVVRYPIADGAVPFDRDGFRRTLDLVLRRLLAGKLRISLKWPRQSARNGHPGSGFWPPPRRPRQRPTRGVRFIP